MNVHMMAIQMVSEVEVHGMQPSLACDLLPPAHTNINIHREICQVVFLIGVCEGQEGRDGNNEISHVAR